MEYERETLDFAYKYPFSKEARDVIASSAQALDESAIKNGRIRLEEDLHSGNLSYYRTNLDEVKRAYVLSYVYSRMLVSAISNSKMHLHRYVSAEAMRVSSALQEENMPNLLKLMSELGMEMSYKDEKFIIKFTKFLSLSSRSDKLPLVKQELDKGLVYLPKEKAISLMESAVAAEIRKKLPIPGSDLPKRVIEEAKSVKLPQIKLNVEIKEGSYKWIERILNTPIADVRHRTVNLILAPYLTNVKGLSEEEAANIILDYIEKCKQLNPDTRINSSYIKYQCKYSKAKGMRPLSLERARDLYKGVLDLD